MQSHDDIDARRMDAKLFMGVLEERAKKILRERGSEITSGKPGELPLKEWESNGVHVRQMPPDEQDIIRVSIGGGDGTPVDCNYCVFRGSKPLVERLLEKALVALRGEFDRGIS